MSGETLIAICHPYLEPARFAPQNLSVDIPFHFKDSAYFCCFAWRKTKFTLKWTILVSVFKHKEIF